MSGEGDKVFMDEHRPSGVLVLSGSVFFRERAESFWGREAVNVMSPGFKECFELFGRPNFRQFLKRFQRMHENRRYLGVPNDTISEEYLNPRAM